MDDKKIRAFLSIVSCGSFSRAAEEIGYTQSAVTQMINSLEAELETVLFTRSYSGARLTDNGRAMLPLFRRADESLVSLKKQAARLKGHTEPLRIGTFSSISKNLLPSVIKGYKKLHPEVPFSISVGDEEVAGWLENGEIDIALIDETRKKDFCFVPFKTDELLAVVPTALNISGDSISLRELSKYPFIMAPLNELKERMKSLTDVHFAEGIHISSTDDTTVMSLIAEGLGVAVLPSLSIMDSEIKGIRTLHLEKPLFRTIGAAYQKNSDRTVRAFVSFIKNFK